MQNKLNELLKREISLILSSYGDEGEKVVKYTEKKLKTIGIGVENLQIASESNKLSQQQICLAISYLHNILCDKTPLFTAKKYANNVHNLKGLFDTEQPIIQKFYIDEPEFIYYYSTINNDNIDVKQYSLAMAKAISKGKKGSEDYKYAINFAKNVNNAVLNPLAQEIIKAREPIYIYAFGYLLKEKEESADKHNMLVQLTNAICSYGSEKEILSFAKDIKDCNISKIAQTLIDKESKEIWSLYNIVEELNISDKTKNICLSALLESAIKCDLLGMAKRLNTLSKTNQKPVITALSNCENKSEEYYNTLNNLDYSFIKQICKQICENKNAKDIVGFAENVYGLKIKEQNLMVDVIIDNNKTEYAEKLLKHIDKNLADKLQVMLNIEPSNI